jgi:hypothetical protein
MCRASGTYISNLCGFLSIIGVFSDDQLRKEQVWGEEIKGLVWGMINLGSLLASSLSGQVKWAVEYISVKSRKDQGRKTQPRGTQSNDVEIRAKGPLQFVSVNPND